MEDLGWIFWGFWVMRSIIENDMILTSLID